MLGMEATYSVREPAPRKKRKRAANTRSSGTNMKTQKYSLDWIRIQKVNRPITRGEVIAAFRSKDIPLVDGSIRMDVKLNPDGEVIHFLVKVGRDRVVETLNAFKDGIELDGAICSVRRSPANKGEIISGNYVQM